MGWLDNYRQADGQGDILSLLGTGSDDPAGAIFTVMSQFLADRRQQDETARQQYLQQSMQQAMEDRITDRLEKETEDKDEEQEDEPITAKHIAQPAMLPIVPDRNDATSIMSTLPGSLEAQIAAKESGGNYKAFNPAGGGEGAVGKYQFRWNLWKDKIANITGVGDKHAFLNNPTAQEDFYSWYKQHELMPAVSRVRPYNNSRYSDDQLARLVHFKGEAGAKEWLTKGTDRTQPGNIPIDQYLKQSGGVAITPQEQHTGLNNGMYDELLFPMQGHHIFRGLDNGQPVLVQDSSGQSKVLQGPEDTMHTYGNVQEHRIKGGWLDKYR